MKRFLWFLVIALNVVSLLAIASRIKLRSNSALRIACTLGVDQACVTLGWRYSRGGSVPVDPAKALAIFEKACGRGGAKSCRSAGDFYNGWPGGMAELPDDSAQKAFRERIKDRARAIHFYGAGCDEGDAQACDSVGTVYHELGDDMKAVDAWSRACKMNSFFGCGHIERLAREGNQIAAASTVTRGSGSPFGGWPGGLRVWLTTFILSIVTGVTAAVTRPREGSRPLSRRTLVIIAGAMAIVLVALTIGMCVTADDHADRMFAYVMAIPALLLVIGTALLAAKGDSTASRVLLLTGGFLSIPPGLIPIMVVHECRATRAASDEPSAASRSIT